MKMYNFINKIIRNSIKNRVVFGGRTQRENVRNNIANTL